MPHRSRRWRALGWLIVATVLAQLPISAIAAQEATPGASAGFPTFEPLPEGTPRADGPLAVVTTTSILGDLVRQVGGSRVEVQSLLPANADAHDYEPAPDDLAAVEDADVVFEHGLSLDAWADDLVANSGTEAPVFVATEGVPTLASSEEEFAEGDPHVWFDPTRVKIVVATIAAKLTEVDPGGADTYAARRDAYQMQLDALDAAIQTHIETIPPERRKLVTNHEALGYYADRYGLTIVGAIIPSLDSRAEPSAEETAALIDRIEAEGVPAIFAETSLNPDLAREIADQTGIKIVDNLYTESLGEPGSGADTYLGLMMTDTMLIVEALR
jgi:ABC-type Zn uptake system ZnuABC Zn-binding protein ZnuA